MALEGLFDRMNRHPFKQWMLFDECPLTLFA
jgi:hypothetical protein